MMLCTKHGNVQKPCQQCLEYKKNSAMTTNKKYDRWGRNKETDKFYHSKEWKTIRDKHLSKEPLCVVCGRPAKIVDHKKEIQDGGDKLDPNNLQSMCQKHHNMKTAEERRKREGGQNRYNPKANTPNPTAQTLQIPKNEGGGREKKRGKIDWEAIRADYENTNMSSYELAEKYKCDDSGIRKKIKQKSWARLVQQVEPTKTQREITTTITQEVTMLPIGEAWSDDDIVKMLRDEVTGKWGLLFFDITYNEMRKKYWTYDYFPLLLAANFYQDAMDSRSIAPANLLTSTEKGDYVSAEYNLHISATANFMKITKELGLNPMSREKASVKIIKKMKEGSLFDAKPKRERKIEF